MTTVALAACKYNDCAGELSPKDVMKVTSIPRAPHHLALVGKCPVCERNGQYVIEREEWKRHQADVRTVTRNERELMAAAIELDAIDSAHDLEVLWRSYKSPPIIEEHVGKCNCLDCWRKRYA